MDKKAHWENIYSTKPLDQVSWYQTIPTTSLSFFEKLHISKDANIIDVGSGSGFLVDNLLVQGYQHITVLDISEKALENIQKRLGQQAKSINWLVTDVTQLNTTQQYDVWHDRAVFHFLTEKEEIEAYIKNAAKYIKQGGHLIVGTFSEQGPTKCSGINIKQYSQNSLKEVFSAYFEPQECFTIDHITPSGSVQNFVFCSFTKK